MKFIRHTSGRALVLRALALLAIAGIVWAGQRADGTQRNVVGNCIEFCVFYWSEGGDDWALTNPPPQLCYANGDPVGAEWKLPENDPAPGDGPAYRHPPGNEVTPLDKSQPFPRISDGPAGGKIVQYCWIHCPEPPLAPGESVEIHVQYMDSTGQMTSRTITYTQH